MGTTPQGIDTEERAKADRVRARLAKETEHIQAQNNLDREGQRARLAAARLKAKTDLKRLGATEADHVDSRRAQRIREFFGYTRPDDNRIVSIRDASDRATRIETPDDAAKLMNSADQTGDTVLLRALAQECAQRSNPLESGWGVLFHTWAQQQPGGAEALAELNLIGEETTDTGSRLMRERAFGLPPKPPELAGASDSQLRALAAQADTISTEENDHEPSGTTSAAGSSFDSRFR